MRIICILLASLLSIQVATAQKRYTISGYVYEKGSKETLIGATLFFPDLKIGTATNSYGFYSVTLPANSSQVMSISFIGYTPEIETVNFDSDQKLNFFLEPAKQLKEVVIDGNKVNIAQEIRMSTISIPVEQLKTIPSLGGEKDIIKALQLLPGVQKGSEGSSGLYVRGGGPDQNLIILDDAPVYNANHLFGFFSAFNGDAIKNVQLIKGGFPARYGGRLSSVVDLTMKDGNQEKITGEAGIGLISSRLVLEGPIKKNKSSFLISGRRTYLDALIFPLVKAIEPGLSTGYYFYDLNAKVNTRLNEKNRLYISSYFGRDKFYLRFKQGSALEKAGLTWGNFTGTARLNHQFSNRLFGNFSVIASDYLFKIYQTNKVGKDEFSLSYSSGIRDYTAKFDVDYRPVIKHTIRSGVLLTYHTFTPSATVVKNSYAPEENLKKRNELTSIETGVYVEDEWKTTNRLSFIGGVRFTTFTPKNATYTGIEPRLSSRYLLTENLSAKASYALMNQYLHLLSNSTPGLPTDLWVPATDRVLPQRSEQVAVGLAREFPKTGFEVTLESYYKKSSNIITYKEGASFFLDDPFAASAAGEEVRYEDNVTSGKGESYGIELFVKYDKGKFNGWVGYTLSKTTVQFDEVNEGKAFFPKYDRRHDISVVGTYKFSERTRLSATWVYGTGNALTLEEGTFKAQELTGSPTTLFNSSYSSDAIQYGPKNGFRAAAYHRLDISIQRTKQKKRGIRTWEYGLYNAYARANPFFYIVAPKNLFEFNSNTTEVENALFKLALFPLIPSISYTYKF